VFSVISLHLLGCSSNSVTIRANVETEVFLVDPKDARPQSLGKTPLELTDLKGTKIYQLQSRGYVSQNLVILESEKAKGTINIDFTMKSGNVETFSGFGRRLDQLLKAHRAFLRGHLADAEAIIQKMEELQGADFGLLVLKGNIAAIRGQNAEAVRYYEMAAALDPEYQWKEKRQ